MQREEDGEALDLVELFFFAYRDFVGDADRLLENYGFGRAHHRVLHFVSRRPGLTIAALLDILKITKQSLNRVLKQLLDAGFVLERFVEPTADEETLQRCPHLADTRIVAYFLHIRCRKPAQTCGDPVSPEMRRISV